MPKPSNKGKESQFVDGTEGTEGPDIILESTEGDDIINGLAGDDIIDGRAGNDTIHGGDGNDTIIGGSGDDSLFGDAGDDKFIGGAGSDSIDGGVGTDTVTYDGVLGVDYTMGWETVSEVEGKGRNKQTIEVTYTTVTAADGTIDRFTNVEEFVFLDTPIFTQDDYIKLDVTTSDSVTIDVLSNDSYGVSYSEELIYGTGLEIVGISDVDGSDLIPEGIVISNFSEPDGVLLNDGSVLKLNEDDSITFTASPSVSTDTTYSFKYTVSHGGLEKGGTVTFDFDVAPSNPPSGPSQTLTLESLTPEQTSAGTYYVDGSYAITQLSQDYLWGFPLGVKVETRDNSLGHYDYDGDGDAEWRVWTESDGTPHEMNVTTLNNAAASLDLDLTTSPTDEFIFESFMLTGLETDEGLTVQYWNAEGNVMLGSDYINTLADLSDDGVTFNSTYEGPIGQLTFSADTGTEVFVDYIVFI